MNPYVSAQEKMRVKKNVEAFLQSMIRILQVIRANGINTLSYYIAVFPQQPNKDEHFSLLRTQEYPKNYQEMDSIRQRIENALYNAMVSPVDWGLFSAEDILELTQRNPEIISRILEWSCVSKDLAGHIANEMRDLQIWRSALLFYYREFHSGTMQELEFSLQGVSLESVVNQIIALNPENKFEAFGESVIKYVNGNNLTVFRKAFAKFKKNPPHSIVVIRPAEEDIPPKTAYNS